MVPIARVESARLRRTTVAFSSGAWVDGSVTSPMTVPSVGVCAWRGPGRARSEGRTARLPHSFIAGLRWLVRLVGAAPASGARLLERRSTFTPSEPGRSVRHQSHTRKGVNLRPTLVDNNGLGGPYDC